jgi:hypothetical protein
MTVRLGPVTIMVDPPSPRNPRSDGFGDNTRCLRRDIGPYLTKNFGQTKNIADVINIPKTFAEFQSFLEGGRLPGAQGGGFGGGGGGGGRGGGAPGGPGGRRPGAPATPPTTPAAPPANPSWPTPAGVETDMHTSPFLALIHETLSKRTPAPRAPGQGTPPAPDHGHGADADPADPGMGLHGVGHFTIAGDPGSDPFISPNDPAFWLHHGMLDRVWSIWQSMAPENRTQVVSGRTMIAARPQTTLDEIVTLDILAKD